MTEKNYGSGIGFVGLLTLIFITLKLIDKIDWSWWFVLSPLLIPIGFAIIWFSVILIIVIIKGK